MKFTAEKTTKKATVNLSDLVKKIYDYDINGFAVVKRIANTFDKGQKIDIVLECEDGAAFQFTFIANDGVVNLYGAMYMNLPYEKVYNTECSRSLNGSIMGIVPLNGSNTLSITGVRKLQSYYPYL